jgi:hypothetical protein
MPGLENRQGGRRTAWDSFQTHIAGNICWPVRRGLCDPSHVMLQDTTDMLNTYDMASGYGGVIAPGSAELVMLLGSESGVKLEFVLAKKAIPVLY